jgi:hypothetical protein
MQPHRAPAGTVALRARSAPVLEQGRVQRDRRLQALHEVTASCCGLTLMIRCDAGAIGPVQRVVDEMPCGSTPDVERVTASLVLIAGSPTSDLTPGTLTDPRLPLMHSGSWRIRRSSQSTLHIEYESLDVRRIRRLVMAIWVHALACRWRTCLHAGAVETPSGIVIFGGPSGVGKSTLSRALHELGGRIVVENYVIVDRFTQVTRFLDPWPVSEEYSYGPAAAVVLLAQGESFGLSRAPVAFEEISVTKHFLGTFGPHYPLSTCVAGQRLDATHGLLKEALPTYRLSFEAGIDTPARCAREILAHARW